MSPLRRLAALLPLLALPLAAGCRPGAAAAPTLAADGKPAGAAALAVRLAAPEKIRFTPRLVATGNLKPQQSAAVSATIPGRVVRILVARGQKVASGALLAELDADAARATAAQARAGVKAAEAQLRLADDALARVETIKDGPGGGVSEQQLTQARAQRDLAAAGLLSAQAQLQAAEVHLRNHQIRAPFAGVVTRVPDGPGITVGPGAPLFALEATAALTLETSVTQEDAADLAPGAKARVVVPAIGASADDAVVRAVLPSVDPMSTRVPLELQVPNADGRFKANSFARAEFAAARERDAWRLPASALVQREGAYALWVAADGKAHGVRVRLLASEGDRAVVEAVGEPLADGARVVDLPPLALVEGAAVVEAR